MKNTTTTTTTTSSFDPALYGLGKKALKRKLTNRVVTYRNEGESTVKADGERQLVIQKDFSDDFAISTGRRYIQGYVADLDDGGKIKPRTLHVAGITKVKGRLATAWALAMSVYKKI